MGARTLLQFCLVLSMLALSISPGMVAGEDDEEEWFTLYMDKDSMYKERYWINGETDINIRVKVEDGGPIDVFLMTEKQYWNSGYSSYQDWDGESEDGLGTFSYILGELDEVDIDLFVTLTVDWDGDGYDSHSMENVMSKYEVYDSEIVFDESTDIFIVIDNLDLKIQEDDAIPEGAVKLSYRFEVDDVFQDEVLGDLETMGWICLSGIVSVIIIFVVAFFYYMKKKEKEKKERPVVEPHGTPYPPYYPNYPHYYPPYYGPPPEWKAEEIPEGKTSVNGNGRDLKPVKRGGKVRPKGRVSTGKSPGRVATRDLNRDEVADDLDRWRGFTSWEDQDEPRY